jgi:hypothetical protein
VLFYRNILQHFLILVAFSYPLFLIESKQATKKLVA